MCYAMKQIQVRIPQNCRLPTSTTRLQLSKPKKWKKNLVRTLPWKYIQGSENFDHEKRNPRRQSPHLMLEQPATLIPNRLPKLRLLLWWSLTVTTCTSASASKSNDVIGICCLYNRNHHKGLRITWWIGAPTSLPVTQLRVFRSPSSRHRLPFHLRWEICLLNRKKNDTDFGCRYSFIQIHYCMHLVLIRQMFVFVSSTS